MPRDKDGGPAFQEIEISIDPLDRDRLVKTYNSGMSLRDYFAAKAMQGMLASNYWAQNANGRDELPVAVEAYRMADAMLSAREEKRDV